MARIIISILLIFISFQSHSQIAMFHAHNQTPAGDTLFLDSFTNASAAYSFQHLRTLYTGNCIRVRRSSDNAEQDIGFVNKYLDTSSLKSFITTNTGYIVTWYDQSGNGRNATQATAGNQPRVLIAGAFTYQHGLPVMVYTSSSSTFLEISSSPLANTSTPTTLIIVNFLTAENFEMAFTQANGSTTSTFEFRRNQTLDRYQVIFTSVVAPSGIAINNLEAIYSGFPADNYYQNSTVTAAFPASPSTINTNAARIGARYDGFYYDGYVKEVILYTISKTADRVNMINNRNRFYSIF